MRILQIIDSLEAGGAERMAVNYANALANEIDFSGLAVTRAEGTLWNQLNQKVSYLFLNKKRTIDVKALFKLRNYVIQNKVSIVHAHGTSFFTAILLKFTCPKIKIIWHEHYGARVKESRMDNFMLLFSSIFFSSVFVVNPQLEIWVKKNLLVKKVYYIPNFATSDENQPLVTFLNGNDHKRIVCLANLKKTKNHASLLLAFKEMKLQDLGWSLHLIGKDYYDSYSDDLKVFISINNLQKAVFIYGIQNDIQHILSQATIGILSSTDEGFPLSLLEYGLAKLPVVSTNVGYCSEIIKENLTGLLFYPLDNLQLQEQLQRMIFNKKMRDSFRLNLHELVMETYSREKGMQLLLTKYSLL